MKHLFVLLSIIPLFAHSQSDWYEVSVPSSNHLHSVFFLDSSVGFIGGDSTLLKTEDGGSTWNTVNLEGSLANGFNGSIISDMHWFSADHGIIAQSPFNGYFETTNGGETWEAVVPANGGFCQPFAMFFFNEDSGFIGGAGCFQGELIDRFDGEWNTTFLPDSWDSSQHITEIEFFNSSVGYASSTDGLYGTTDGGFTWDTLPNLPNYRFTDVVIDSETDLYLPHDGQWGILESTDGGLNWQANIPCATFFSTSLNTGHKSESGVLYFGGGEGLDFSSGILFEKDGAFCYYETFEQRINGIGSHDNATFLVGDSGTVFTNNLEISNHIDSQEYLSNSLVYPNPANQMVTIEKSNRDQIESISIYDLSGKEVSFERTVDSDLIQIQLPELATGLYTLQVKFKTRIENHQLVIN